jgi:hypothetical protein
MPIGAAKIGNKVCDFLEFGTGDIGLGTIHLSNAKGEKETLFAFATRKPTKIGFVSNKKNQPGVEAVEVIFHFTKIESLDVLIGALQEHKEILQKESKES